MRRRSPQEKNALSYAKDRRDVYGENDKSSRKNIPLHKRLVNKANRHTAQQQLREAGGLVDLDRAEHAEVRLAGGRPKVWRKQPDMPLGEYLERRRARAQLRKQQSIERADDPGR
jgi:hypothetical protein